MNSDDAKTAAVPAGATAWAEGSDADSGISLLDLLTWLGDGKRTVAATTAGTVLAGLVLAFSLPYGYTARTSLLPPGSQQQSSSAAAIAALGSLGGLAGGAVARSPDEMYVALLRSDSVQRALADRFDLQTRWGRPTYEQLRQVFSSYVRIAADKKSGVILIEVDDPDPAFAANLANGYASEVTRVLGRLSLTEAQQRRQFFEQQLKDSKDRLVKAEADLRSVQERSGVIVLDKQTEALLSGAALVRAQISEREVQLKVLRTSATEQNPDVMRLNSELSALRGELSRMESDRSARSSGAASGATGALDIPVGRIPEASIDYLRARRELKLQETLLEGIIRQYEGAKLDEARDGPALQVIDAASPPDRRSRPKRVLIVLGATLLGLIGGSLFVVIRAYLASARAADPTRGPALAALSRAWQWRR